MSQQQNGGLDMRYRRLDENNDYVFGQNNQDFVSDADAVKQAIYTRLKLLYGEWWEDTQDGFPFFEQVAGKSATPANLQAVDLLIQERIQNTEGVLQILDYVNNFNSTTRELIVYTKVNTIYGDFELEVTF